mmetsp:Transcript_19295/g.20914  ORF Transcript_19295/g.20914 Transcript_19295/m.20914 type:complete len:561 (+) Transcript_19295:65-1747(+)
MSGIRENLREACELGSCTKVKEILKRYPTILNESCTDSGIPLLIYAVMYNRIEIIYHLLSIPSLNVNIQERETENTALIQACARGRTSIISLLLSHPTIQVNQVNREGNTCLIQATMKGLTNVVEILLSQATNLAINHQNQLGMNALMYACSLGPFPIIQRLLSYSLVPVQLNLTDREKETVLHKACHANNVDVILFLLTHSELTTIQRNQAGQLPEDILNESTKTKVLSKLQEHRETYEIQCPPSVVETKLIPKPPSTTNDSLTTNLSGVVVNVGPLTTSSGDPLNQNIPALPTSIKTQLPPTIDTTSSTIPSDTTVSSQQSTYPFDVFLSHNWGKDTFGRDNHERVKRINLSLQERGVKTWFDEEQLNGNLREGMARAITTSRKILIFLTQVYCNKIESRNSLDNCYFEFNFALSHRRSEDIIVVVLEESASRMSTWGDRLKAELGSLLFLKLTNDENLEEFNKTCEGIVRKVRPDLSSNKATSTIIGENEARQQLLSLGLNEAMIEVCKGMGIDNQDDLILVLRDASLSQQLKGKMRPLDQLKLDRIQQHLLLPSTP